MGNDIWREENRTKSETILKISTKGMHVEDDKHV